MCSAVTSQVCVVLSSNDSAAHSPHMLRCIHRFSLACTDRQWRCKRTTSLHIMTDTTRWDACRVHVYVGGHHTARLSSPQHIVQCVSNFYCFSFAHSTGGLSASLWLVTQLYLLVAVDAKTITSPIVAVSHVVEYRSQPKNYLSIFFDFVVLFVLIFWWS